MSTVCNLSSLTSNGASAHAAHTLCTAQICACCIPHCAFLGPEWLMRTQLSQTVSKCHCQVHLTTARGCCCCGQVASAGRWLLGAAAASSAAAASGSSPSPQDKFVPVEQQPKKQHEFFEVRYGHPNDFVLRRSGVQTAVTCESACRQAHTLSHISLAKFRLGFPKVMLAGDAYL